MLRGKRRNTHPLLPLQPAEKPHIADWRAGKSRDYTQQERKEILETAWAEATVIELNGRFYEPVRIAKTDEEGRTPLDQCKAGECVFAPGLVYRERQKGQEKLDG